MIRYNHVIGAALAAATIFSSATAQDFRTQAAIASQARMRPIGSPSAVDKYRQQRSRPSPVRAEFAQSNRLQASQRQLNTGNLRSSSVRQVAMMQDITARPLAGDAIGLPPDGANAPPVPRPDMNATLPRSDALRSLPANPSVVSPSDLRGNDLTPMSQPALANHGFATIDNCNCISAPSGYTGASGYGCGSVAQAGCNTPAYGYNGRAYVAPPAQIAAPAVMPTLPVTPTVGQPALGAAAPPRALISLGQQLNTVQVGQGLWGQPVAYVPGQTVRNWIRYFFP